MANTRFYCQLNFQFHLAAVSIGVVQSEYTVEETDLNAEICLRLDELQNGQLGINVTVGLTTADVTASTNLVPLPTDDTFCNPQDAVGDYETVQILQVEFFSTNTVGAISCTRPPITINDDTVVEDPETFIVSIIDSLPPGINVDSSATSATVTIISDVHDRKYDVSNSLIKLKPIIIVLPN